MIDPSRLVRRVLFDTTALIAALCEASKEPGAEAYRELFDAFIVNGHTVLVAAPSLAELLRRPEAAQLPRREGLVVGAFDAAAARTLAEHLPLSAITPAKASGAPAAYIKYDALIVACAIRHRAECMVTRDGAQSHMAKVAGLRCASPGDFQTEQLPLGQLLSDENR